MAYQALYRKYRPDSFSDVIEQTSILKTITNSIKNGKISHAYLFSGPRGTGKTTIAKLLAKTVNCLNVNDDFSICHTCENCLDIGNNSSDIIEIDAASNNGVDEIRELKSKINLVPTKLKYKVYIIDEVHMLSISAFNALLKTLEEPPEHVIFILATTEFYKVPTTIISRCQCLNFTKIKTSGIVDRLRYIADLEDIKIEDAALLEIANYSDGGMRDAISMLDKMASYSLDLITVDDFQKLNGLISKRDLLKFIDCIIEKDSIKVIECLSDFNELGYDFSEIVSRIMIEIRNIIVAYYVDNAREYKDINLLYQLLLCFNDINNGLKDAANRKIVIEVKLLKFIYEQDSTVQIDINKNTISREIIIEKDEKKEEKPIKSTVNEEKLNLGNNVSISEKKNNYEINKDIYEQRIKNTFATADKNLKKEFISIFNRLDDYLASSHYGVAAGLLKDCTVAVVGNANVILSTKHEAVLNKFYTLFEMTEDLLKEISSREIKVVILTEEEFKKEVNNYKKYKDNAEYYKYQIENKPLVTYHKAVEKEDDLCYGNLVQKAIDVFGENYIEIE